MGAGAARPRSARLDRADWGRALAGFSGVLIGIGFARFGFTPLIPALVLADWFGPADAVLLGATNLAGYLAGAVAADRVALRLGPTPVIRWSMLVAAASFAACAFPAPFAWFALWRFASGVCGSLLMVLVAPLLMARTAAERRGKVSGFVFTGIGVGIALSGTIVPLVVETFGLTAAWATLAAISLALTAAFWTRWPSADRVSTLAPPPAPAIAPGPAPAPAPASKAVSGPVSGPVSGAILMLLAAYAADAVGFVPHTVFVVDFIARGLGLGLETGGAYWMLFGLGAMVGPVAAGALADRIGFRFALASALLAKAGAVALPLLSTGPAALGLSCMVAGALTPGMVVVVSGRALELAGGTSHRRIWGWMTAAFAVAQAAAAYAMSFLFAATQSYPALFAIGAAALAAGAVLAFLAGRQGGGQR
ncbi:YbfB/YjiJ family MFS transporter [Arenibaculum sp.]|jgi:predicted MFS family arabinose efflux permease|uniref:YbfB/YjiJ family MFS transporter n=1 Tax=Arenibaculum sp. TaxID=2865862 RepID=UPI002E0E1F32|nr:YbfB/YjiJ family MFS transporter [Arenibaculum sp.]